MNNALKSSNKHLEELLESDDEFPSDYVETPRSPAYQDDHRFDQQIIRFQWLKKPITIKTVNEEKSEIKTSTLNETLNEETLNSKTKNLNKGEKILVHSCILNNYDILCLKSIEKSADDTLMLWFINFLTYKDLQSDFKYLKSVLVDKTISINSVENVSSNNLSTKRHNFDIIVRV